MVVRQSVSPVYSQAFMRAVADAFTAVLGAAIFDSPTVHLMKSNAVTPTPNTALADLTAIEADFTDYAAKALTLSEPINFGSEDEGASGSVNWIISDAGAITGNTVYGYWIEVGGNWLVAEKFANGQEVSMTADADQLILALKIPVKGRPGPIA